MVDEEGMKVIILDWMDGRMLYFKNKSEAMKEFNKLVLNAKKNKEELDVSCFRLYAEFNNLEVYK